MLFGYQRSIKYLCILQKKESHIRVWNDMRVSKQWKNLHFWCELSLLQKRKETRLVRNEKEQIQTSVCMSVSVCWSQKTCANIVSPCPSNAHTHFTSFPRQCITVNYSKNPSNTFGLPFKAFPVLMVRGNSELFNPLPSLRLLGNCL